MNTYSLTGIIIVQFALIFYSVAIITEQRKKIVSPRVLSFLTLGIIFDITSTAFMILGSSRGAFTIHGILGYSSLAGMLADTILIWWFYKKSERGTIVTGPIDRYSLYAYLWWITAYATGALLVTLRHI